MTTPTYVFMVDDDNYVHARWCQLDLAKKPIPYFTVPRTATALLAHLAKPDTQSQFGSSHSGPGILRPCQACINPMAESEVENA